MGMMKVAMTVVMMGEKRVASRVQRRVASSVAYLAY